MTANRTMIQRADVSNEMSPSAKAEGHVTQGTVIGEPVRVAHVIGKLSFGGVEAVVFNYYRNIDRKKYQFDFIIDADSTIEPPKELIDLGARFYVIPPYQHLSAYIKALEKLFTDNRYSIVHAGMNTLSVFSLYAAKRAGVPVRINHSHSTAGWGELLKNCLKNVLRPFSKLYATHLCACSIHAGEWQFGKRAMEKGEVTIINNAIEVEKYRFNAEIRKEVRRELGYGNELVIGHVGRFCFQKNQEFLIDIFAEAYQRNRNCRLMLVGTGKTMESVKKRAEKLGVSEVVDFLGVRNDVHRLYQAMDCFAFPSHYEGLGLAAVEAQCAGVPVIVSDAVPREVKASDSIIFLPLFDRAAWVSEISKVRQSDRNVRIESQFDMGTSAKILEAFYDSILDSGPGQVI